MSDTRDIKVAAACCHNGKWPNIYKYDTKNTLVLNTQVFQRDVYKEIKYEIIFDYFFGNC